MKRKIVRIDEDKCNGCGQCVSACVEGALKIVDGKARLVSDTYCDGLGACLGECPQDAIIIEEREASAFDEKAVEAHLHTQKTAARPAAHSHGGHVCPGTALRALRTKTTAAPAGAAASQAAPTESLLGNWPVQLMLVPPAAPFLKGAHLLISADCVPFAFADFHRRFLDGRVALIGCPKLDDIEFYREKLEEIFRVARPASVTVLRMEVPCCAAIAQAAIDARNAAAPDVPIEVDTIGIQGSIKNSAAVAAGEIG